MRIKTGEVFYISEDGLLILAETYVDESGLTWTETKIILD